MRKVRPTDQWSARAFVWACEIEEAKQDMGLCLKKAPARESPTAPGTSIFHIVGKDQ